MKTLTAPAGLSASQPTRHDGFRHRSVPRAARPLLEMLGSLRHGTVHLTLPDGSCCTFGNGEPRAAVRLANWKLFREVLARGDIGLAESYIAGDWSSDDLHAVLDVAAANRDTLERAVYGRWWGALVHQLRHRLNRNSRAGSRRNIHAHYDLGNRFYALWLDRGMTYSSALFEGERERPLSVAQDAKYLRILERLDLPAGASVLEVGCGWGGFAQHAAADGLRVKGLTLSTEQLAWARRRLADAGLAERVQFALQDYRDERDRYDGIASIEMFEAVGERYWPAYFEMIARCLKERGRAVIQTITIADELFERYRRGTDFIQQYVFPGGMLPSPSAFEAHARRAGLHVTDRFAFGPDYATTLRQWRVDFTARLADVAALGFDERFVRIWSFYLAYCEAAFRHGSTDVHQFTLERA